jgi:hypothetical protein
MPSISRECPRPAALAGTRNDLLRQYENGDQGVVFPDQPDVTTNLGGSEIRTQNRFEFGLGARRKSELVTVTNSDLPQGMLAPPQRRAADRRRKRRQLEREKLGLRRFTLWLSLSDRAISLLAANPMMDATEAFMVAHCFTIDIMVELVARLVGFRRYVAGGSDEALR